MNGNKTHSVHFDSSVHTDPDSGRSTAAAAAPAKRNSVVRKILLQTIGEQFEDTTLPAVQSFVAGVENYCASTESLASLGKSLYTSPALVFVVDEVMRVILWNDCAVKLCGYSREEMAGRNLLKELPYLVPPPTAKVLADALAHCVRGAPVASVMLEFTSREQAKVTLLGSCTPLVGNPVGSGMLVVAQDLTHLPFAMVDKKALAETPAVLDQTQGTPSETQVVADAVVPVVQVATVAVQSAAPATVPAPVSSNASKIPGWSEIAPNYSIECVLGQGSYGQVVRCKHLPTASTTGRKRKRLGDGSTPDESTLQGVGVHPRTPARRIQRQLTEHVVTRWYRAPEIIFRDHDYSAAIDVWSVGCIFAELLSMQKSSVPSHYQREPIFPGVSCFPLSPGAGQVALPQDSRDQLNTILDVLGTMEEEDIAEIADPDVQFYLRSLPPRPKRNLQEMYPGAEPEAIDLLTWMLKMNPQKRATLDEALSHKYLASIRSLEEEIVAPGTIQLEFDEKKMNVAEIRQRMISEIRFYHPAAGKRAVASSATRASQPNGGAAKKAKQG
ncbi:hypothetical protein KRP22_005598 [Phytophthora ramorum]|nr:Mitogen-activated protein kinase 4 [Phytophthora ramorum]